MLKWSSLAAIMLIMAACSSLTGNNPTKVVEDFGKAMQSKDLDAASKFCTRESQSTFSLIKAGMDMAKKFGKGTEETDKVFNEWNKSNAKFCDAKITGDNATVAVIIDGAEKQQIPLKKEDGVWKIDLSINGLIQSNTETLKKDGGVSDEDMQKMQEAMKGMNSDSVKQIMQEAQKAMEEAQKK